jgi:hypothetical protein
MKHRYVPPSYQPPLVPTLDPVGELEHAITRWTVGVGRTCDVLARVYAKARGISYQQALSRIERSLTFDPADIRNTKFDHDWIDGAMLELAALEESVKGVRK